jgi:hypothetical protein
LFAFVTTQLTVVAVAVDDIATLNPTIWLNAVDDSAEIGECGAILACPTLTSAQLLEIVACLGCNVSEQLPHTKDFVKTKHERENE